MRAMLMAGALMLAAAAPAAARDLPVPPTKGWQHAETGLILMASVDGLTRTALTDATATERDVAAQYGDQAQGLYATVYLFHPVIPDVSIWFDRSRTALEDRKLFKHAAPASADPIAFAAGGSTTPSSLRQAYAGLDGEFRSTALSITPMGDWIVAIRMSGKSLTADALDARLKRFIAALRWPAPGGQPAPAAVPITPCATSLAYTDAKPAKAAGSDVLMSLLGSMVAANAKNADKPVETTHWCRDGAGTVAFGVYRANDDRGYSLALGDSGRVIDVTPTLAAQTGNGEGYSVRLTDVDGTTTNYGAFATLPRPQQAFTLVTKGTAVGRVQGTSMTVTSKAFN